MIVNFWVNFDQTYNNEVGTVSLLLIILVISTGSKVYLNNILITQIIFIELRLYNQESQINY